MTKKPLKNHLALTVFLFCLLSYSINAQSNQRLHLSKENKTTIDALFAQVDSLLKKSELDSAKLVLETITQKGAQARIDTIIGKAFLQWGILEKRMAKYKKADSLLILSIKHLEETPELLIEAYLHRGGIQNRLGNLDSVLLLLDTVRVHIGNDTISKSMLGYLTSMGTLYGIKLDYVKELDYYLRAKKINEKINYAKVSMMINENLVVTYQDLKAYDLAMELNEELMKIAKEENNTTYELSAYVRNMYIFIEGNKLTKVIEEGNKAINLRNQSKETSGFGMVYYYIGKAYLLQHQLDSAAHFFNLGIAISQQQKEENHLSSNYVGMCLVHLERGNYEQVKEDADKATDLSTPFTKKEINKALSFVYEQEGNYQKALQLVQESNKIEEEKDNKRYNLISDILKERFEQQKKTEQLLLNQQIERQQFQLYLSFIVGFLFLILTLGLIWAYQIIQKRNDLLRIDLENKKLIETQAAELQKIDALKARLFANIAHELRTPLSLISGPVKQLMNQASLSNKNKEVLNGILSNSEQLLVLSNQIQELSKDGVIPLTLTLNRFSLNNFLEYLQSKYQLLVDAKRINLRFPIIHQPDVQLLTDAKKLENIIDNLLSNALKYTNLDGEVSIKLKELKHQIELSIEDTGRGIAKEDLPYIFDRYYQAKSDKIIAEGGIGIGLSICKEYAQLLGATLQAKSELGKGSTFLFRFPKELEINQSLKEIEQLQFVPLAKQEDSINKPDLSEEYILIVEDNLEMCNYFRTILEAEYDLLFEHNGKEALRQIENKEPVLVITDLMMPIMGGMEFINIVKGKADWSAIPILVLTAKTSILDEIKALRIGVDDYITKPFDDYELKTIIYNLLYFAEEKRTEREITKKYLLDASIHTSANISSPDNASDRLWLTKLEEIVDNLASDIELTVDKVAVELSITSTYLNRKIKLLTGLTTKKYITEVRLLMARRMIERKEVHSVKAAAYSVGFKSEKVFSRNFKARFGKNPSTFFNT